MSEYVSAELRRMVIVRAGGLCEYCLIDEVDTFFGCQVDHVIAIKHGGPTVLSNLTYACALCNRAKGSDIGSIASENGDFTRFFNPRLDHWADHFRLSLATIEPTTAIGEVTAKILGFNTEDRQRERKYLTAIGRFPPRNAEKKISR